MNLSTKCSLSDSKHCPDVWYKIPVDIFSIVITQLCKQNEHKKHRKNATVKGKKSNALEWPVTRLPWPTSSG